MWNEYQAYANAQNARIVRAQRVSVGQHFNPGTQYQAWANTFNSKMINADDPRVPHTPVENMARGSQMEADSFLDRMTAHDDLQLRGLGYIRPSGSMARNIRAIGATPNIDKTVDWAETCKSVDWRKWLPPLVGYMFGYPGVKDGADIKDVPQVAFDQTLRLFPGALECTTVQGAAEGTVPTWMKENGFLAVGGKPGVGWQRAVTAGRKMHANGWWVNSDWYDYWVRWSGFEPFYKNPYYVGGVGVVGVAAAWLLLRKKRK